MGMLNKLTFISGRDISYSKNIMLLWTCIKNCATAFSLLYFLSKQVAATQIKCYWYIFIKSRFIINMEPYVEPSCSCVTSIPHMHKPLDTVRVICCFALNTLRTGLLNCLNARSRGLTFRHRASCIKGQAFRYSPESAFYIFNQQIYFIIWYLLDGA